MKIVSSPGFLCGLIMQPEFVVHGSLGVQRSVKLGYTATPIPREANVLGTVCGGTGRCKIKKQVLSTVTGNMRGD